MSVTISTAAGVPRPGNAPGRCTLFTDLLEELGVPHTTDYSLMRFDAMNFRSLFGLSKLLAEYGIDSEAIRLADKEQLNRLPVPFLAQKGSTFMLVTDVTPEAIMVRRGNRRATLTPENFKQGWSGVVFMAYPRADASEPGYLRHRTTEIGNKVKHWLLAALLIFLSLYFWTAGRLYASWPTVALTLLDLTGIYISWLLMLKMLGIHSERAERVCGVIERGGCDTVLQQRAAKFYGLFGWSEVGLAYFTVSFVALIVAPEHLNYLAAINLCCLPFSFWSIWYQRTRAKAWCTLCLTVQALLWLKFACFLRAGAFTEIFPLRMPLFVIGACYVGALLVINMISPAYDRNPEKKYLT